MMRQDVSSRATLTPPGNYATTLLPAVLSLEGASAADLVKSKK
jgi:hypothetical protein